MDEIQDKIQLSTQPDKNVKRKIVWDLDNSNNQVKQMSPADILKKRKERFGEISPPRSKFNKISNKQAITVNSSSGANLNILKKRSERFGVSVGVVDISVLKKRSERFGESVSSLVKKLEDKDKMKMRQARFSNSTSVSSATVKKNLIAGTSLDPSTTVKLFKTIDQIDAERRWKLK